MGILKKVNFDDPNVEIKKQYEIVALKTNKLKQTMLTQSKELDTQFKALMQKTFARQF